MFTVIAVMEIVRKSKRTLKLKSKFVYSDGNHPDYEEESDQKQSQKSLWTKQRKKQFRFCCFRCQFCMYVFPWFHSAHQNKNL